MSFFFWKGTLIFLNKVKSAFISDSPSEEYYKLDKIKDMQFSEIKIIMKTENLEL